MQFRTDINGLRAIAVIAVVLYHFNESWMPGGFAGVDVFFVISGFLMTKIIFRGIEQDNFSILQFYVARANRIIPALAVLCIVLLILGWFYIIQPDYKSLGKHIASSMGFLSNITYWSESGYFDAASHEKWLLHTWSLSVEWQFYMIYPLVLIAMRRFMSLKSMKLTIFIGTIVGFIICVVSTYKWPNPAYYLLSARAWEMMIGGLAYLYPFNCKDKNKKPIEWLGLSLIFSSYFLISKEDLWPGYLALIPVLGAFFVIQAQRNNSLITGNVIFQKLGSMSYSIYLWHWPLVVAIYYFSLSNVFIYIGILLSLALGFISNRYIETIKLNNNYISCLSLYKCKPLYMVFFVAFLGASAFEYMPNKDFHPMPESVLKSIERKPYECFDKEYQHNKSELFCTITDGGLKLFSTGDSHSYTVLPVIEALSKEQDISLTYTGYSGCPPLLGVYPLRSDQEKKDCNSLNEKIINYVVDNEYDTVFLAARWTYYTEGDYSGNGMQYLSTNESGDRDKETSISSFKKGLSLTFKKYSDAEIKVIVMLQVPMQEANPDKIYYKSLMNDSISDELLNKNSISKSKHSLFQDKTNQIIIAEARKYKNIFVIDPTNSLCEGDICRVGDKNISYYFDDDHLSISGSRKLESLIKSHI